MKKITIIKKNIEFERIINQKNKISNKYYSVFFKPNKINRNNYGISVPKKTETAVIRNKIKRQIKNIIDNNQKTIPTYYDYVIIVRKGILELKYKEMEIELLNLFKKVKGE